CPLRIRRNTKPRREPSPTITPIELFKYVCEVAREELLSHVQKCRPVTRSARTQATAGAGFTCGYLIFDTIRTEIDLSPSVYTLYSVPCGTSRSLPFASVSSLPPFPSAPRAAVARSRTF